MKKFLKNKDRFLLNFKYAFRPRKPLMLIRLIKNFFDIIILKKQPLRYADFAINFNCNLKCQHCFATALKKRSPQETMTISDYKRVAEELIDLGCINFSFQGGEPLLNPNLGKIITAFQPHKSLISITTNGTLLTEEKIKWLKKIGVDILTISLDSSIPEEHDNFRGVPGTFGKTMKGIKLALKNGLRVTIGTTISHENIRSKGIIKLLEICKKLKVICCFNLAVPAGNWKGNKKIMLTENDSRTIKKYTVSSPYIRTDFQANYLHQGCGSIKEILYFTLYGDVLPCPFIHISLGNIFKEGIRSIRDRGLKNKYFTSYYPQCLAAQDKAFIKNYLVKTFNTENLPVPIEEIAN